MELTVEDGEMGYSELNPEQGFQSWWRGEEKLSFRSKNQELMT